jgi:hypothetical protein
MQICGCGVYCAVAYLTKKFFFFFFSFSFYLSFFLIELSLLFTHFLTEYIVICVSVVLTVCVSIYFVFL